MNTSKIAIFSAYWLIAGFTALSSSAYAADAPAKKPAASQPVAKPAAHDMASHDMAMQSEEQKPGGAGCSHMGGMMGGQMGGKMCDHKGGMMGGQMGGKMCDHKGGMMGGQMGGQMCDHKGGMMGGHGAGMMMASPRMSMVITLDLNEEQRSKINKLSDELQHNNWATKGLIMDESAKLRDLYAADKRDPSVIGKEYRKIFDLQLKIIEATVTTQNRIEEILTPEQRAKLKSMRQSGAPMHDHPMH